MTVPWKTILDGFDVINRHWKVQVASYSATGIVKVGNTKTIVQTTGISAVQYHAGDAVGGKLTFLNAVRSSGEGGMIANVVLKDLAKQNAPLILVLFDRDFTATADHAAFDPSDADMANCIGFVSLPAANYASFSDNSLCVALPTLWFNAYALHIYGQLYTTGTPTYVASGDLSVRMIIQQT
jgi:hypothetical protein